MHRLFPENLAAMLGVPGAFYVLVLQIREFKSCKGVMVAIVNVRSGLGWPSELIKLLVTFA